jgi:uncharacterized OB-fold protein
MSAAAPYPQPLVNDTNRPLVEAWRRGELHLQQCDECGHDLVVPRELCPQCWSPKLRWIPRSGRGRVVTVAAVYSHVTAPFADESPVLFGEIELSEGGVMLARIVDTEFAHLQEGSALVLVDMPHARRYPLPTFRPLIDRPVV